MCCIPHFSSIWLESIWAVHSFHEIFSLIGSCIIWVWIKGAPEGGSFFGKSQGVPNFQVLLDFYLTISKNFPISVGLRSGRTRPRHQCQGGEGLSPSCPPMNLLPFQIHWNLSQKFPFFWCPFTLLEATFVQIPFEIF